MNASPPTSPRVMFAAFAKASATQAPPKYVRPSFVWKLDGTFLEIEEGVDTEMAAQTNGQ